LTIKSGVELSPVTASSCNPARNPVSAQEHKRFQSNATGDWIATTLAIPEIWMVAAGDDCL